MSGHSPTKWRINRDASVSQQNVRQAKGYFEFQRTSETAAG